MGGLARRAAVYEQIREQHENVFVVDAGNLLGNRNELEKKQTEFLAEETEAIGYEVFGVGERDLNYGLDFLRELEQKHGFVFTNANLPELREKADLIILLAQIGTQELRQLLIDMGEGTGIDICVEGHAPRQYRRVNRVGDVLLVAANNQGKYAGQLDMLVTAKGEVEDATVTIHTLDDKAPEIPVLAKKDDWYNLEHLGFNKQQQATH